MDDRIYSADELFGEYLYEKHPLVLVGYHVWARPVVQLMIKSDLFTRFVAGVSRPWAIEMAHEMGLNEKGSLPGKLLMFFGFCFCGIIGFIVTHISWTQLVGIIITMLALLILIRQFKMVRMENRTGQGELREGQCSVQSR